MKRASIAELKAKLSEYVARAKAGEDVLITDRGRPVARLVPLGADAAAEARVADLVRAGLARPPRRPLPADFLERPRPADPEGRSLEILRSEREQSW
jgi:prevent-host-death family protein